MCCVYMHAASEGAFYRSGRKLMLFAQDQSHSFPRYSEPPPAIPSSMKWLLAACVVALATLPWAIPALLLRIVTP